MPEIRIQKLLATWGLASRRTIEEWISQGRIAVNGSILREQGCRVDPENARITLDGKPVQPPVWPEFIVMALHKPFGILTSMSDPFGRPTIRELLPEQPRLYPIGRLDYDSTGLLLVTNYGELANRLMHPRYKVEKEYVVSLRQRDLAENDLKRFSEGVALDDAQTLPCRIERLGSSRYRVVLREGRNRQIRRMFQVLGYQVGRLQRVRFGPVFLGDLPAGVSRPLSADEYRQLLTATGLEPPAASGERDEPRALKIQGQ